MDTGSRCQCGCASPVKGGNQYIRGHNPSKPKFEDIPTTRDLDTGCLLFHGTINSVSGYGYYSNTPAHRIAYERATGCEIPVGMTIDHVYAYGCRHRNCIEPSHLEVVTRAENTRREMALRAPIAHCQRGHPLNSDTTYFHRHGARMERKCRECFLMHSKLGYLRRRTMPLLVRILVCV